MIIIVIVVRLICPSVGGGGFHLLCVTKCYLVYISCYSSLTGYKSGIEEMKVFKLCLSGFLSNNLKEVIIMEEGEVSL